MRVGEILVNSGALTQEELDEGLSRQRNVNEAAAKADAPALRLGQILVARQMVQPEIVDAAVARQSTGEKKAGDKQLIRVHSDKLDHLIDLIGELVIAGASTALAAQKTRQAELVESTRVLARLVENIRDSALQLRMVQIGETFNRFHRVVRDTAKELGKQVTLGITGADTELDKSVVEKIGDPLMHLVRNAMDHGLEPAEDRTAKGKPASGRIELNAFHDSGNIVIEVADDGRGLPKEKIRTKAIERGVISESQVLSEQEIINLIFEPGFSTADKVTDLSGRGVGLDVVRRNIQALRGSVDVHSREGEGSRFTIRLPLTLAIIDGFLVGVNKSSFVIPLEMVVECMELTSGEATSRNYINLRGEVLPIVRLRELFEVATARPARENVVVIKTGGRKAGIVVDVLHGELQTVIKPLAAMFRHLRGIAGSSILGSGEVALILDVHAIAGLAADEERRASANAEIVK
jgi:two-component system, chemotaxis family, sensor kinase CheA